jgi:hypothetical protein
MLSPPYDVYDVQLLAVSSIDHGRLPGIAAVDVPGLTGIERGKIQAVRRPGHPADDDRIQQKIHALGPVAEPQPASLPASP